MKLNVISSKMKSNFLKNNFMFIILILFIYFKEIKLMKFELSEKILIKNLSVLNFTKSKKINNNRTIAIRSKSKIDLLNKNNSLKNDKIVVSDLAKINIKLNRINELINRYEQFSNFTKNNLFFDSKFKFRVDNV
jgi:hypothetical protein